MSGIDSPVKILFVLVIALIVLGPKRLPEVGRSLGQGIREFRSSMSGVMDHHEDAAPVAPPPVTPVQAAPVEQPSDTQGQA
jgi:sec-independent protein translocase protein TatA